MEKRNRKLCWGSHPSSTEILPPTAPYVKWTNGLYKSNFSYTSERDHCHHSLYYCNGFLQYHSCSFSTLQPEGLFKNTNLIVSHSFLNSISNSTVITVTFNCSSEDPKCSGPCLPLQPHLLSLIHILHSRPEVTNWWLSGHILPAVLAYFINLSVCKSYFWPYRILFSFSNVPVLFCHLSLFTCCSLCLE